MKENAMFTFYTDVIWPILLDGWGFGHWHTAVFAYAASIMAALAPVMIWLEFGGKK